MCVHALHTLASLSLPLWLTFHPSSNCPRYLCSKTCCPCWRLHRSKHLVPCLFLPVIDSPLIPIIKTIASFPGCRLSLSLSPGNNFTLKVQVSLAVCRGSGTWHKSHDRDLISNCHRSHLLYLSKMLHIWSIQKHMKRIRKEMRCNSHWNCISK